MIISYAFAMGLNIVFKNLNLIHGKTDFSKVVVRVGYMCPRNLIDEAKQNKIHDEACAAEAAGNYEAARTLAGTMEYPWTEWEARLDEKLGNWDKAMSEWLIGRGPVSTRGGTEDEADYVHLGNLLEISGNKKEALRCYLYAFHESQGETAVMGAYPVESLKTYVPEPKSFVEAKADAYFAASSRLMDFRKRFIYARFAIQSFPQNPLFQIQYARCAQSLSQLKTAFIAYGTAEKYADPKLLAFILTDRKRNRMELEATLTDWTDGKPTSRHVIYTINDYDNYPMQPINPSKELSLPLPWQIRKTNRAP